MNGTSGTEHFGSPETRRSLFFTDDGELVQRMAVVLNGEVGVVQERRTGAAAIAARLDELGPQLVMLDFNDAGPGRLDHAAELTRALARLAPGLPLVAAGSMARPQGAVAALRAGVRDFVDPDNADETREAVLRLLRPQSAAVGMPGQGQLVVVLGVRAGMGSSTLAVHLASMAHMQAVGEGADDSYAPQGPAVLLDLGLPACDSQLYLNVSGNFHFAEAVRNLHRLDATLVNTAVTRNSAGLAVIALPRDLLEIRSITSAAALGLIDKLRQHFGTLVADLGGFGNPDFVVGMAQAAEQVWLLTDQSVGGLVSLADTLHVLDGRDVPRSRLRLVVNRYDERYGMAAEQIAKRFDVSLLGTLPDRTLAMMNATNQGRLLHEVADRDPYVRAVQHLLATVCRDAGHASHGGNWLRRLIPGHAKPAAK